MPLARQGKNARITVTIHPKHHVLPSPQSLPGDERMSKRNARLKSLYRMGQTSSQVAGPNPDDENGQISDGAESDAGHEVGSKKPKKSKKRKSLEALDNVDNTQAIGDGVESNGRGKSKNKKRKKRKSAEAEDGQEIPFGSNDTHEEHVEFPRVEEPDDEEAESARALLQLRNDTQYDSAQSPNDDTVISAQVNTESSPARVRRKSNKPEAAGKKSEKARRSSKKAKRSQSATQDVEIDDNVWPGAIEPTLPKMSAAHRASRYLPTPSLDQQNLPQSTLSLDDIDSNDETLAPYLQSYENEKLAQRFDAPSQEVSPDIDDSYTQLATDAFKEATAAALRTEHTSPRPTPNTPKGRKSGRKRASNLPEEIFAIDDGELDQPLEEPEQPRQKRRYKKRARKSGNDDEALPVDPQIFIPGLSTMQVENYQHSDHDLAEGSKQATPGKLKRPSKALRKGKNAQSSNLEGFVIRDKNVSHTAPDTDDEQNEATQDSDQNLDPELLPSRQKRAKRRVLPVPPPNASQPTFKVEKRPKEGHSSSQPQQGSEASPSDQNRLSGPFTKSESDLINAWRESYCAEHQWSYHNFDERVQANARNDGKLNMFWTEICDQIPYRPRQAIQKFCRRRFHNFEKRGTWTPEEDEMLKRAVAEKGKSWKTIGETMGRLQEDCRDRWRNYLYQDENRNTDAWTDDEVKALVQAVGECLWLMQNELQIERDAEFKSTGVARDRVTEIIAEEKLEKLLNWQIVSDRMQGRRSRLQCSYKWGRLMLAGRTDFQRAFLKADREKQIASQTSTQPSATTREDWRVRKSRIKVKRDMRTGDKLDLLQALLHQRAKEEKHIVWTALGKGEPWRKKWDTMDLKVAWIIIKSEAGEEATLGDRYLTVVNSLIEKFMVEAPETEEYRWFERRAGEDPSQNEPDGESAELANLLAPLRGELSAQRLREQEGQEAHAGADEMDSDLVGSGLDAWLMAKLAEFE